MLYFWCFCHIYRNHDSYGIESRKEGGQLQSEEIEAAEAQKVMSMPKSLLFLVVGVAGIVIGGDVVVDSASNIALKLE